MAKKIKNKDISNLFNVVLFRMKTAFETYGIDFAKNTEFICFNITDLHDNHTCKDANLQSESRQMLESYKLLNRQDVAGSAKEIVEARLGDCPTVSNWLYENCSDFRALYSVPVGGSNAAYHDSRLRKVQEYRLAWLAELIEEFDNSNYYV